MNIEPYLHKPIKREDFLTFDWQLECQDCGLIHYPRTDECCPRCEGTSLTRWSR